MKSSLVKRDKLDKQLYYSIKGDFERSDELLKELLIERPNDNRVLYNSAFMYLRNGDIEEGMKRLNRGRFVGVFGSPPLKYRILGSLIDIRNKNILVNLEGGFGDNFVGLKFAKELKKFGANVYILALKQLNSFLSYQPYITKYYNDVKEIKEKIDYWCPSLSFEHIMNYTNYSQIPRDKHLFYPVKSNIKTKGLNVGIKFQGSKFFDHDKYRSPKVSQIIDVISKFQGKINFYSLEKEQLDLPEWIKKVKIDDFCDTSNIIQQMDFVISTCTSIAHLSAGLGKKTYIMIPILPYWLWAYEKEDNGSWYYDNVELIRQEKFGTWENVLEKLRRILNEKMYSCT
jgi:hypothetical protein